MSSSSSDTVSTLVSNGNPESKAGDHSQEGEDPKSIIAVPNGNSQVRKDALKGDLKGHPVIVFAIEMLKNAMDLGLIGDEKADIALQGKIGRGLFKSMPTVWHVALQEAATIKASQAFQYLEKEKVQKKFETGDTEANSGGCIARVVPVFSGLEKQDFSVVKDIISNFVQNSQALMDVLDEVAKVFPFIQVAVSLFKAGLSLEVTRRENNDKVIALNLAMCDMMQVFTILQKVADPKALGSDGLTVEKRLEGHMDKTIDLIEHCTKVCDSYQKERTIVKFFKSTKWKVKFTHVAQEFVVLRDHIKRDLDLYTFVGIATMNATIGVMSADVSGLNKNVGEVKETVDDVKEMVSDVQEMVSKFIKVIFERIQSPEEREVASLVAAQPGGLEAVLKNDTLLGNVLAAHKSKDGKRAGARRHATGPEEDKTKMVSELRKEMEKPVEQVLEENTCFDQKLELVRMQVGEVKVRTRRETDRQVIDTVSGPEGIVDLDIYQVWNDQDWGDSTDAKLLVLELYNHFAKSSPEDHSALKHIPVLGVQLLIEELSDDVSPLVTVSKVNAFTAARPNTWSLPHWISYWTYGFEMTVQWYLHRIHKVITEIDLFSHIAPSSDLKQLAENVLPGLRNITEWDENVLPGLRNITEWDDFNWEDDYVFLGFKDYVAENEGRMERNLRKINYYLDEANTLTIVAGEGRLEKYVLPLILLLMRRALWVVKEGGKGVLQELKVISGSLSTLTEAVYDRILTLQGVYKLRNQYELSKFFFGLYQIHTTTSKNTNQEESVPSSSRAQNTTDVSVPVGSEAAEGLKHSPQNDAEEEKEKLSTDSKARVEKSGPEEPSTGAGGSAEVQATGIGSGEL